MNIQTYVIILRDKYGGIWPVGTDTKRGFTERGATKALEKIGNKLPNGWKAEVYDLSPISLTLASKRQ